ncbi:DNA primase subunit pri2 [Zygosaccharomyces mellis]|uniref:DNA primase large subunit n=1 Tax=Zygosaccharomyces mellis TaxID=42258 RepID=A0A4C2E519_9SACH|nr:DNA primase subunit pri2 [Zygosaccharomyces mellis]
MFRQNKKRISSRRHFSNENSGSQFIMGQRGSEAEKRLYDKIYESKLSFYELPPQGEITLDQFEIWAIDRLKVLLELESCVARNKTAKETETIVKPLLQKLLPFNTDNLEDKKKDYYSHFILRLCFCRTKDLRDKFVRAETLLFKLRFNMLTSQYQTKFVQSLDLPMLQFISEEEKIEFSQELYQTIAPQLQFQLNLTDEMQRKQYFQNEKFIKLPFESVIDLVGSRQVFLKKGFAYLPQFQQLNLLSREFSHRLEDELMRTFQHLPHLNEDDRLIPILTHLSTGYTISDYQQYSHDFGSDSQEGDINSQNVYSKEILSNFPLCAKNLFNGLQQQHHLRYNGRQQLSFFLKGIGLSADEALRFWAEAFTAKGGSMTMDKFNKEYRYNFRHNYGLEGSRISYRAWDCRTILSKPRPARGEFHGCPYRDWNVDKLTSELAAMNLTAVQMNSILESCQKNEFTIACTKVFENTHGQTGMEIDDQTHIAHPNLYFERSRQWQKKHNGDSAAQAK